MSGRAGPVAICRLRDTATSIDWKSPTQMNAHVAQVFKSQPHPAVLPHLRHSDALDMSQSGGRPQETLGTGRDTVADCGFCLIRRTENLAWPRTQKKWHPDGWILIAVHGMNSVHCRVNPLPFRRSLFKSGIGSQWSHSPRLLSPSLDAVVK